MIGVAIASTRSAFLWRRAGARRCAGLVAPGGIGRAVRTYRFPVAERPAPVDPADIGIAVVVTAAIAAVERDDLQASAELLIDDWMGKTVGPM